MAFSRVPNRRARSQQTVGTVSHDAQQRVDKRVIEIVACRDAAEGLKPPPKEAACPARRVSRRAVAPQGRL
jgi:hypothetical protein